MDDWEPRIKSDDVPHPTACPICRQKQALIDRLETELFATMSDRRRAEALCDYDQSKAKIVGWEYSANGWDGPHFSPRPVTHAVAWKRPRFECSPNAQSDGEGR